MKTTELLDWLEGTLPLWEEAPIAPLPINPGDIDLQKEYIKLNKKFFDGKLGMYPMKWNRRKGAGALVKWKRVGGEVKLAPPTGRRRKWKGKRVGGEIKILSVEVSTYYQSTILGFISRLTHEMIHVFLLEQNIDDGHGSLFKQEMRRINSMNPGFEVKVSEKVTDYEMEGLSKGPRKRVGVIVYDDRGILVFGPKHFADTFFEVIGGFDDSWLQKHNFEWYWADEPWLAKYPMKRKIGRGFGTYKVTPDEIKQIKKGQFIAKLDHGDAKTLMPKYFGGTSITGYERMGRLAVKYKS